MAHCSFLYRAAVDKSYKFEQCKCAYDSAIVLKHDHRMSFLNQRLFVWSYIAKYIFGFSQSFITKFDHLKSKKKKQNKCVYFSRKVQKTRTFLFSFLCYSFRLTYNSSLSLIFTSTNEWEASISSKMFRNVTDNSWIISSRYKTARFNHK